MKKENTYPSIDTPAHGEYDEIVALYLNPLVCYNHFCKLFSLYLHSW